MSAEHCPGCGDEGCPGLPVTEPGDQNLPGYHGEGELADFDPGTGRSSLDDWDG